MEIYELSVNGRNVSNFFDENGEETFDKMKVVEYSVGHELFAIIKGDVVVIDVEPTT